MAVAHLQAGRPVTRRLAPRTVATIDRVMAILRDAEGFPLSTGEIARQLGVIGVYRSTIRCAGCDHVHVHERPRRATVETVRPLLKRLEADGRVEGIKSEFNRHFYWRAS